jgi:exodeoxyribonuclease III
MRLLSWNVNGIRACIEKGFLDVVHDIKPDILCIQETKAQPDQVELELPGYIPIWNSAERKGYSGCLILTKYKPRSIRLGLGFPEHDSEGRVITIEYPAFYLTTVYTPNVKHDLSRLNYRQHWDHIFLNQMKKDEQLKPVIFCGDLNVAHNEIDLANPQSNRGNAGFTDEERAGFDAILNAGFIDTFRHFTKEGGHYSWWSYRNQARKRNIGWRIDYFCISSSLVEQMTSAFIRPEIQGSDHCPVGIELHDL